MSFDLKLKQIRNSVNKFGYITLGGMMIAASVSCQASSIAIEKVTKQNGKTVYLTGKVVDLAPFVDNGAYQLQDPTGKVWIVSDRLPQLNQQIRVKGKIAYQSLPFAEQELGDFYLIELEQLEPESDRSLAHPK